MKNLFFFFCLLICLFSIHTNLLSQLTNRWEVVDSSKSRYSGYYPYRLPKTAIMSGIDNNDIVVIGGNYNMVYYKKNRYVIKRYSENAGRTEIIYNDSVNIAHRLHSISHPTKNVIVIVGDTNDYLLIKGAFEYYKSFGLILLSTDGGSTWQRNKIDSNKTLSIVSMCDSLNGIIIQSDIDNYYNPKDSLYDTLLITSTCWKTVRKIPVPVDAGSINSAWCLSPQNYFLLCQFSKFLYYTTDGGITWKRSAPLDSGLYISNAKFLTNKKIFVTANRAVGDMRSAYEPSILKSEDGGDSWIECKNVFREIEEDIFYLQDLDFYDELNGIAVGREGKILRTTDGGNTWEREYIPLYVMDPSNGTILSIFYPKKGFAFAVMSENFILNCYNNKILMKPKFYGIYNPGYMPLNDVKISWTSIAGADKYWLKIDTIRLGGTTGDYDFEHPLIDTLLTDSTLIIKNLEYNTVYHYWVKSMNDSMESDWSDENSGFATIDSEDDLFTPNLIYPPIASRVDNNKVTLRWHKVPTAERYKLLVSNSENSDVTSEFLTDTSFTITDLVPSAFYYIEMESVKGSYTSYERWSYFRTRAVLGVEEESTFKKGSKINVYPNPFSNYIALDIKGNDKPETIIIYDLFGREIQTQQTEFLESGKTHHIKLTTVELPQGLYFVRLQGSQDANVVIKAE